MGIAKALFDSAYNAAKAEKWYLEVRESNLGAISFYEKLGFVVEEPFIQMDYKI